MRRPTWILIAFLPLCTALAQDPAPQTGPILPGDCGLNGCMEGPGYETAARVAVRGIAGQVLDYTANSGFNHRVFSPSLQMQRDLYIYLPPGYDPCRKYPAVIYLHGVLMDENSLIDHLVQPVDRAIREGRLPPLIVACPDGSMTGNPSRLDAGSFYVNGPRGRYQDWIVNDTWEFVLKRFSVCPTRKNRILCGVSMGGFGAYNIGLKYADKFGTVVGLLPALNLRWVDCHNNYLADFHPCCWGWRTSIADPCELIGEFGIIQVRMKDFIYPVFGRDESALRLAAEENPIELLDKVNLQPNVLNLYVGIACQDEFNLDAQAFSFLYRLREKGLSAHVKTLKHGRHNEATARAMIPDVIDWLAWVLTDPSR